MPDFRSARVVIMSGDGNGIRGWVRAYSAGIFVDLAGNALDDEIADHLARMALKTLAVSNCIGRA